MHTVADAGSRIASVVRRLPRAWRTDGTSPEVSRPAERADRAAEGGSDKVAVILYGLQAEDGLPEADVPTQADVEGQAGCRR